MKTSRGRFFEDFSPGEVIRHATPRTLGPGERALHHALYPARHALQSSDAFARAAGLAAAPLDDLMVFHTVFGRTVPDVSLNAVANLGYAEGRFLRPVFPGETLRAESEVIGVRQTSSGRSGIVWVRTRGSASDGPVLEYVRWVLLPKRDGDAPAPAPVVPELAAAVEPSALAVPEGLDLAADLALSGEPHRWGDYEPGEVIDHGGAVTVEETEHMMATRLWQNTARVHFDASAREDGRRLVYGGHVMSLARALSFDGLANAQLVVAINDGTHAAPCFAGDTVRAWTEVLDRAETAAPGIGALRLRLVATKGEAGVLRDEDGRHHPDVLLELDHWVLVPT